MTSSDAALAYAARGWRVFPCQWRGAGHKRPLTKHGLRDASTDAAVIAGWWRERPDALIAMPTGLGSGRVVLDVDRKGGVDGLATLAQLGFAVLPATARVRTPSGGLHLHFDPSGRRIPTTQGAQGRGIGLGLDWRGEGGYAILPTPGSAYLWEVDRPLAPVPAALLPRPAAGGINFPRGEVGAAVAPDSILTEKGERAVLRACLAIRGAPNGEQEATLNSECFAIGGLAGAGGVPVAYARAPPAAAPLGISNYDLGRPWSPDELIRKVNRSFDAGLRRPRVSRNG